MLVCDVEFFELCFEGLVVDVFEDIFEESVMCFEDGIFCGEEDGYFLGKSVEEAGLSEVLNT